MNLSTAASIVHPGPQDQTLALADDLIGAERIREATQEREANVAPEYRAASKALQEIAINLHAYSRGMVGRQVVPSYIAQARTALDAMERALS